YFELRLPASKRRLSTHREQNVRCPFHDDKLPSFSINIQKGVWNCHAGCGGGGILDFEMRFMKCDRETASANVADVLGKKQTAMFKQEPEATYEYRDAFGKLLFEKLRYPGKRFVQRKPAANGRGHEYTLGDIEKPLYRLPEVLVANHVVICEGEKDVETVRNLNLSKREKNWFLAATTNFDGAGKWRDEYSVFLVGKVVVILPDNDETGRQHAEQVAQSVYRHTQQVRIVTLPGLPEHGDVTDWMNAGHSVEELLEQIRLTTQWRPHDAGEPKFFVSIGQFCNRPEVEVNWLVEGLLERGANGAIVAEPKVGKSWLAADLAISIALGVPFLGFKVPQPVKVAFVSREDNPTQTNKRLRALFAAKNGGDRNGFDKRVWMNTREEMKQLLLDNPDQFAQLLADLRIVKPEFLLLDVMNTLHERDENDNREMRQVFARLEEIQREIGCSIGLCHHYNKNGAGSMTQRIRGSSAIAGWCEWMIGIEIEDPETQIRKTQFELKAAEPPHPVRWTIASGLGTAELRLITEHDESDAGGRVM
ncbi:MAG: AAA family ATPase, partial [Candidatus Sulfotelmatobacter sp.]